MLARITALFFLLGALLSAQSTRFIPAPPYTDNLRLVGNYVGPQETILVFADRITGHNQYVSFLRAGEFQFSTPISIPSFNLFYADRPADSVPIDLNRMSRDGLYLNGYGNPGGVVYLAHNGQINLVMKPGPTLISTSEGVIQPNIKWVGLANPTPEGTVLLDVRGTLGTSAQSYDYAAIVEQVGGNTNRQVADSHNLFTSVGAFRDRFGNTTSLTWNRDTPATLIPALRLAFLRAGSFAPEGTVESWRLSCDPLTGDCYTNERNGTIRRLRDLAIVAALPGNAEMAGTISDHIKLYGVRDTKGNITKIVNYGDMTVVSVRGVEGGMAVESLTPPSAVSVASTWDNRATIPIYGPGGVLRGLMELTYQ